ncbi:hypothetical protein QWZ13_09920 [Reinekea marina]|uniref:hypothetical protein n=1 Tax=Reinekea marina TaxID=1310421 RepID=UPI0025B5B1A8|nr:hypothetical protein [Reinekea marina]MDN3649228.1 hypothetical protein [Reinekea marina]
MRWPNSICRSVRNAVETRKGWQQRFASPQAPSAPTRMFNVMYQFEKIVFCVRATIAVLNHSNPQLEARSLKPIKTIRVT